MKSCIALLLTGLVAVCFAKTGQADEPQPARHAADSMLGCPAWSQSVIMAYLALWH